MKKLLQLGNIYVEAQVGALTIRDFDSPTSQQLQSLQITHKEHALWKAGNYNFDFLCVREI